MAKEGTTPKTTKFDPETDKKIEELRDFFGESTLKVLTRAVNYLYEKREENIDYEANKLKEKLKLSKK